MSFLGFGLAELVPRIVLRAGVIVSAQRRRQRIADRHEVVDLRLRREVTLARPRLQAAALRDADVDRVGLAVAFGWNETEQVLTVQFVGNGGECGAEIL